MPFQNKISINYWDIQGMKNEVRHSIFLLAVISCLAVSHSFSQQPQNEIKPEKYRAVHWDTEQKLPSGSSHTMIKDVQGFLWIGSSQGGSCRFDGAVFKKIVADKRKNGSLNFTEVFTFKEDSLHNIWIGTNKGLSRYDIKADTFTNFSPFIDSAFSELRIAPFWSTKDSVYCIEPGRLITAFNIHTLKRKSLVRLPKEDTLYIEWNTNKSFFDKGSGSVWALNGDRAYGKLQQIFLDGRSPQYYRWPCYNESKHKHTSEVRPRHNAEDIKYDPKRNSVWINSGEGLIEFSLASKQFRRVEAMENPADTDDYDRGVGIDIDKKGRIWFGSFNNGIFIYDPETNQIEPVFSDGHLQETVGNSNLHIYHDPDGITWVSNWNKRGIYQLIPSNPSIKRYMAKPTEKNSLSSALISTILNGPKGKLWFGTADGINIFDPITETFEVLREKDLPGLKGKAILPLYIDTLQHAAWLNAGSQETEFQYWGMTMYEMDLKTRKCTRIQYTNVPKQIDKINVIHTLVRPYKDGIIFCDEMNGIFEVRRGKFIAEPLISFDVYTGIGAIGFFNDSTIFLQGGGGDRVNSTLKYRNGKWVRAQHLLDTLNWTSMIYNKNDQTIWISFRDKLIHYDKEFNEIKVYDEEDGYAAFFMDMEFDNEGNLWFINVVRQLGRFNPATELFTYFSESDGYFKRDYIWYPPITKDAQGRIYTGIGWQAGVNLPTWWFDRIYPEKYSAVNSVRVYLSSLTVNQKIFPLSIGVNSLEKLSLKHDQNTLRFETGIINFYSKEKGHIRYRLEKNGQMGEWIYPTDYIIRLEDLRPARYRLVIQASNASSEFIGPEKILMINIPPPFWETWWFRTVAVLALIGIIYGFMQYRSRNLKQRNILLEKKVTERTNDLNKSLLELKTTQDQLIHSEKMASLGELTSGIAHEIKNPLNFINNFSEINMDLINEVIEEQIPRLNGTDHSELLSIVKTLQKNSDKINHHGKRVDDIVKSMLQHSRVGNMTKEPVNINALCEESLKLAYHGFKAKEKTFNAAFETNFTPGLPKILVIPQDMGRVLLNIINNAFYAVHEKKKKEQPVTTDAEDIESTYRPMVIVSTKKTENKILVIISDNGMGISQKIISKIFQPFFTTKPTGEGTGLGLSMSYDIVTKSHGGELHVKSIEGEGTEFEIILPVE